MAEVKKNIEEAGALVGQATPEQIAAWKKSHPQGIYQVVSNSGSVAYFRNPKWNDLNYAMSHNSQPLDPLVKFANTTFIGGDQKLLADGMEGTGVLNTIKSKMDGVPAKMLDL